MKKLLKYTCCLISLIVLSACSMKVDLLSPGAQVTTAQIGILKKYNAYYISPIRVYAIDGETLNFADPADEAELNEIFRVKLLKQFGRKATNFSQPSAGVAHLIISISDVAVPQILYQLKPGLQVPNAERGGAVIEARFIDSVSKKDLVTYRDSQSGRGESIFAGFQRWESLKNAFDLWAAELAHIAKK